MRLQSNRFQWECLKLYLTETNLFPIFEFSLEYNFLSQNTLIYFYLPGTIYNKCNSRTNARILHET